MISKELFRLANKAAAFPAMVITSVIADLYIEDVYIGRKNIGVGGLESLCRKNGKLAKELINERLVLDEDASVTLVDHKRLEADLTALLNNPLYRATYSTYTVIPHEYAAWNSLQREVLKEYVTVKTGREYCIIREIWALPPATSKVHFASQQVL